MNVYITLTVLIFLPTRTFAMNIVRYTNNLHTALGLQCSSSVLNSSHLNRFFSSKNSHTWPHMFLGESWRSHMLPATVAATVKDIHQRGRSVQEEFTEGLISYKKEKFRRALVRPIGMILFEKRREFVKDSINHHAAIRQLYPESESVDDYNKSLKLPDWMWQYIKTKLKSKGLNPDGVLISKKARWCAGYDLYRRIFIGVDIYDMSSHKLSRSFIKACLDHEIEHICENDAFWKLNGFVNSPYHCYYNGHNSYENKHVSPVITFNHAQEFAADQLPALEGMEETKRMITMVQKIEKDRPLSDKFVNSVTHPYPGLRLRALTMILKHLQEEQKYKAEQLD